MANFFRVFEHLLPRGRAWALSKGKCITQFFDGLTGLGDDTKLFFDQVYEDLDPQRTRELDKWERQFYLPNTGLTEQQRRDRLDARWKEKGGQDPRYIEDTLRGAGFDVYVHEWWFADQEFHTGYGACDGAALMIDGGVSACDGGGAVADAVRFPVAKNPRDYLADSTTVGGPLAVDNAPTNIDGGNEAVDGATSIPRGYPLVNIIYQIVGNKPERIEYIIPDGQEYWPYFLYIGGQNFPEVANVPGARRLEFETLCLKLCPSQQWLGMLVNYS